MGRCVIFHFKILASLNINMGRCSHFHKYLQRDFFLAQDEVIVLDTDGFGLLEHDIGMPEFLPGDLMESNNLDTLDKPIRKGESLETIATAMNTAADKCVDFYDYACGSWIKVIKMPSYLNLGHRSTNQQRYLSA